VVSSGPVPVYRSSGKQGYSSDIRDDPRRVHARKLPNEVDVRFATTPCAIQTREGVVHAHPGDAILTGTVGEQWCMSPKQFRRKYRPLPPTTAGEAGRYVNLPYRVMGLRMSEPFEVLLADGLSRLTGQAGDWLVDYGDGSLGVVSGDIFAATYEITH
jgi:hypothetical protein